MWQYFKIQKIIQLKGFSEFCGKCIKQILGKQTIKSQISALKNQTIVCHIY